MAHISDYATIGGVKIKIADGTSGGGRGGKSQTVNVYDESNIEGNYREVYRSRDPSQWVKAGQLRREVRDLESLDAYLIERGFMKEGARSK